MDVTSSLCTDDADEALQRICAFLERQGIALEDVDVIVDGRNGDEPSDAVYEAVEALWVRGLVSVGPMWWPTSICVVNIYGIGLWLVAVGAVAAWPASASVCCGAPFGAPPVAQCVVL